MSAVMHAAARGSGDNRAIHYAVLASLGLHGALLFAFPPLRNTVEHAAPPSPIVARLVEPAPAPQATPAPPREEAAPRPEKPRVPVAKPRPAREPRPLARQEPKRETQTEEAPAAAPTTAPAAAEAAPEAPPAPLARVEAQPAPSLPSAEVVETDSLARYRLETISLARRLKRYPPVAIDNNWQGTAQVRVSFAEGKRSSVTVVKSSGHEVLDRQAVDLITKAFVPVPAALRGKDFAFEIPVRYSLDEG
jgi:protein TonB